MITFKQFIAEKTELALEELASLYRANCTQWQNIKKPLWRYSASGANAAVRGPRERKSKSVGGTEKVQDYVFSLPGWEKFPDRKTSVFCSTNQKFEVEDSPENPQNQIFAIYPYDNTLMGYTEGKDFNMIHPFEGAMFGSMSISAFQSAIHNAAIEMGDDGNEDAFDAYMDGDLAKVMKIMRAQLPKYIEKTKSDYKVHIFKTAQELIEEAPTALSPEGMGCKLVTPKTIKLQGQHEVWFSDKYLSIPQRDLPEFIDRVKAGK